MAIRFDGRVAIVTGAGQGLGRSHAMSLAERGAKVVVNDPGGSVDGRGGDASVADRVVEEIRAKGGTAVASYASVSEWSDAQTIVETCLSNFGKVDILVNNAGILRDKSLLKMTIEDFEQVLKVHLMGTVHCTKAVWPHLLGQKYGRVVFTTSGSGIGGSYGQSNYGAAKTAMLGLMNCLLLEGAKSNVLVNCICPMAATRMTEKLLPSTLEKWLTPESVAPAVAWLASEECKTSGNVITAGAGYFANMKLYKTDGVQFDPTRAVTLDMFAEAWPKIDDWSNAAPNKGMIADIERKLTLMGKL